jgi:hypothetical protein
VRKNLVRKTLQDYGGRNKEIKRSRRNLNEDNEELCWNAQEKELEERIKRNGRENILVQGQDRAATCFYVMGSWFPLNNDN